MSLEIINTENKALEINNKIFEAYINYLDVTPKTTETYTKALKQLFKYLQANNIKKPNRDNIIAFREELKETGHKPNTIQNYIIAVRLFFRWTAQTGLYPNIADHLKGAKINREHKKDYLAPKQIKQVLAGIDTKTLQGLRDYAIVALMVTGGLRTIEISRANIEDLKTLGNEAVLYVQGKGREEKAEYIKVMPEVEQTIRNYLKARTATPDAPLFVSISNNSTNKRMTTRSISGIAKKYMINAGYNSPRLTAHSLRHSAVTISLMAGESLEEVQKFARHKNITTTMIYNHAIDMAKNNCSRTIAKTIF